MTLKYPNDRVGGHVLLTDGNGEFFVPDFEREHNRGSEAGDAMRYAGAFLILARRLEMENKEG